MVVLKARRVHVANNVVTLFFFEVIGDKKIMKNTKPNVLSFRATDSLKNAIQKCVERGNYRSRSD